eukprot:GHVU01100543.1.p2 GENE.GHVU01100543.1~~GHVU01100543.1.p2  ORF type:complete len:146 (-),score=5.77 GHVU01100543.1:276-713(-)
MCLGVCMCVCIWVYVPFNNYILAAPVVPTAATPTSADACLLLQLMTCASAVVSPSSAALPSLVSVRTHLAGKSTLLSALLDFVPCSRGSIFVDGVPVRTMKRETRNRCFGVLAQTPLILRGWTVRDYMDPDVRTSNPTHKLTHDP